VARRQHYSQVLIDLAGLAVLAEETTEDTLAAHPHDLGGHAGLRGTLALSGAGVAALALGCEQSDGARTRVYGGGLNNDAAVLDELLNVNARVGAADFRLLVRVQPDFALADAGDGRREPLLRAEVHHGEEGSFVWKAKI
jgi:hypothetical protein